jgi:energy-coupling factor transport system ATP-binding protein
VAHLRAGYNGRTVLEDVSLNIGAGEFVALMGDNGSGKTTFLQCLLGLLPPIGGDVIAMGQDTRRIPVSRVARQVGYVFQNPDHQLFADSVWEEATLAPRNFGLWDADIETRTRSLLAAANLAERLNEHPYRLSYGEKRRLTLISVLAYGPPLILLDEVLIGQDPDNAAQLLDWLAAHVAQGGTVVLVNHAPELIQPYATRLVFFRDGEIVVDAPPEQGFPMLAEMGYSAYLPGVGV